MSIIEGRQEAENPARLRRRPRTVPPAGPAPILTTAPLPSRVDNASRPRSGGTDAISREHLAYAVYPAAEPPCLSRPASCERKQAPRFTHEDVSDEMLLRNVAEGDKAAMHIMFARHRGKVSHMIRGLVRNPSVIEDLVSQVFLDVWRSANRFESRARVSTWLLSIARFKAINSRRERTHETIDRSGVLDFVDTGDTPEAALDRKETSGILYACLDKLSPAHREIIELFYYREKSVAELSTIVGIPQATAKSRIFYARKQLARILVDAGFEAKRCRDPDTVNRSLA
ncbi:sigma-70 family RNA polymerase sigma factor [Bradyrhizobium viridifuturi]|uniref:sigma-70 family RNA polymerase sigma factor n=1 Tax=Bradyrhizobium viridifuturi TaxID=1654716 RepID=UPI000A9DD7EA|nr:sigma-70 family RNA polymerase sigma factor [Bradyrhizobium viridifuturi]